MTDEQRLQMITEQLILVRDNLFRGMSKSMQKLQARNINKVLELENFTQSPQRKWVGLEFKDMPDKWLGNRAFIAGANWAAKQLKEKNVPKA